MIWQCLRGGTVYDPAHGVDGVVRDIWVCDGKIVAAPGDESELKIVNHDLSGQIVMPGGVDMHCHIAGPKVNRARGFLAGMKGNRRKQVADAQSAPVVANCVATGQLFAGLGYTSAIDAAIPGLSARLAHHEFSLTPFLDKAFLTLFGNNHYVLDKIRTGEQEAVRDYCGWMLHSVHSLGVKIVNPGGVENWKQISRKTLRELDEPVSEFGVSPRQIVHSLARAVDELQLPHAVHIHCNNLGYPGNWETTLHTMQSLEGHRGHFAHVQFNSYAGDPNNPSSFASGVEKLVEYVAAHPEISVDVGHVCPGEAMTITGDAPFAQHLQRLTGSRWYTSDTEQEASCGVIPGEFKPYRNLVHATQWAIGLEWYLRLPNPWQVAMSSDHPNGGAFVKYPEIIHLLMDKNFRQEMISRMPGALSERCPLNELDREYTLNEIAIITRAAPAKILGLKTKGHLGAGADADITVYTQQENITEMFQRPKAVFKSGRLIVKQGELLQIQTGQLLCPEFEYDAGSLKGLKQWFDENYSIRFGNYRISEEESPCCVRGIS